MASNDPREAAFRILLRIEKGAYASFLLASRRLDRFQPRDRALIYELVLGVLRHRSALDFIADTYLENPARLVDPRVRDLLRLGLYQLQYLDRIPVHAAVSETVDAAKSMVGDRIAGLVNAVLRRASREPSTPRFAEIEDPTTRLSIEYSHPRWLVERWIRRFGEARAAEILTSDNETPPVFIHLHEQEGPPHQVVDDLVRSGIQVESDSPPPGCWRVSGTAWNELEQLVRQGRVRILDRASQWIANLVGAEPGSQVLDLCAAPGGKCFIVAENMRHRGRIVACDLHAGRLRSLVMAGRRPNSPIIGAVVCDATMPLPFSPDFMFDRVLVDAPCSGSGTLRRNPDLRWRLDEREISHLAGMQLAMLRSAATRFHARGRLVYSTCSLEPEENEEVVLRFIDEHPEFQLEAPQVPVEFVSDRFFRTDPAMGGMDGFFAAVLSRA